MFPRVVSLLSYEVLVVTVCGILRAVMGFVYGPHGLYNMCFFDKPSHLLLNCFYDQMGII